MISKVDLHWFPQGIKQMDKEAAVVLIFPVGPPKAARPTLEDQRLLQVLSERSVLGWWPSSLVQVGLRECLIKPFLILTMSAAHLLKKLAFSKAHGYELVSPPENTKKEDSAAQARDLKTETSRLITFTFKFNHPVIVQVVCFDLEPRA